MKIKITWSYNNWVIPKITVNWITKYYNNITKTYE